MNKKWICTVCGYVHEGPTPPERCPQCKVPASKFKELTDEEVMAKLETLLPDFPKWDCGGNHFSIEEEDIDGQRFIRFYASAAEMSWIAYKTKLIANGFRMKYRQDTATWYKEVEGRYPAVHLFHIDYDACEMQLVFYYETQKDIEEAAKL